MLTYSGLWRACNPAVVHESSAIPPVLQESRPAGVGITGKCNRISPKVPVACVIKNLKGISNFSKLGVVYNDAEKDTVRQAGRS